MIEKELKRKLVWLPCRHHVMEIILRGVFEIYWSTTSGPNVPIFGRFKNSWDKLDQSKYKNGMEDEAVADILTNERAETVTFINNCLQVKIIDETYSFNISNLLNLISDISTTRRLSRIVTIITSFS